MVELRLSNVRPWGRDPRDVLVDGDRITDVREASVELVLAGGRVVAREGEVLR